MWRPYPGRTAGLPFQGSAFGATVGSPFSAFQATTAGINPYNPVCPWPLINQMIEQIATYVNQMQTAQAGGTTANAFGTYGTFGTSPLAARAGMMGMGLMGRPMK